MSVNVTQLVAAIDRLGMTKSQHEISRLFRIVAEGVEEVGRRLASLEDRVAKLEGTK